MPTAGMNCTFFLNTSSIWKRERSRQIKSAGVQCEALNFSGATFEGLRLSSACVHVDVGEGQQEERES